MSDGGGETGKQFQIQHKYNSKKSTIDDFVQAIANIAVAQICESVGFQGFQQSAIDTLSDVTVRYVHDLGKNANLYANLAGRTEGNVFDVVQGLEDLGLSQGFSGASEVNRCLAWSGSGLVRGIAEYVSESEDVPFAYSIPAFPVTKERNPTPSFMQAGEVPPGEHIPAWLPAFPNADTYVRTGNVEHVNEHKKDDESLRNMQEQLPSNGSESQRPVDPGDASKAKRTVDSNPFLASPLRFGEREVSSVVLPPKLSSECMVQNHVDGTNYVSVLETFAPAIESIKNSVCDSEEGREKDLLDRKSAVQFKLGAGKKSPKAGITRTTSWFGNENLKDDKKRRVEQILKESIENPHELAQL